MPPLTQEQLNETLILLFGWADFSCLDMPKLNSLYCHVETPGITFTEPSLAKQSFRQEADINHIVNQYHKTGLLPQGNREPLYGDFSSGDDYQSALIKIQEANQDFDNLPSNLREKFHNNPAELLSFIADPANTQEAVTLGLLQDSSESVGGQGAQPHTPPQPSPTNIPPKADPPPTDPPV